MTGRKIYKTGREMFCPLRKNVLRIQGIGHMDKTERVTEFLRVTFETMDQAITIYDSNFRLVA